MQGRGGDAPYRLIATRRHEQTGDNAQRMEYLTLPLADVAGFIQDKPPGGEEAALADGFWFRLEHRGGAVHRVALARGLALCGVDSEGDAREFAFATLTQVRFCAGADSVVCSAQ